MSVGLMCDCPLPPMKGLRSSDKGHGPRLDGKKGCPNYAADQQRGGLCQFCGDAERIGHITHHCCSGCDAEGHCSHGYETWYGEKELIADQLRRGVSPTEVMDGVRKRHRKERA